MRARSLSVPLVPTAMPGERLTTSGTQRFERRADVLFESFAIGFRRRVVVHALGREPPDTERARSSAQRKPGGVTDHDLDAAAADVDARARARVDARRSRAPPRRSGRASSRPLMTSTSTPVSASMRSTSSLPLPRAAHRARGLGDDLAWHRARRRAASGAAPRRDRPFGGRRAGCGRGGPRRRRGAASPSRGRPLEGAVGVHVGDEKVKGVRAEVERCDAHVARSRLSA